ncbi:BTB and MATH domain-containing protein 41 [Borealophlyctis nickersoniae]|nr:BTB and MATH domain-containing protein 41 [Borealophlyctis nickersoniae]
MGPSLLFAEDLSDIKIMAMDGVSIPAHRAFLHASAYFRAHASFSSNQGTPGNQLNSDFSSLTIRSMLEFLYTGSLITHAPQSSSERRDLIRLADMYQIPNLHAVVAESIVANDLNEKNARELLVFAHKHGGSSGCGLLRDACVVMVRSNLKTYALEKGFAEWIMGLDPDLVKPLYANEGGDVAGHGGDSK